MYINDFQQQALPYPGSMLKAKTPGLGSDHSGIFAGTWPLGTPMVLHSRPPFAVLTSLNEFALGRVVEVVDVPCTFEHQRAILGRAYSQIGHPYDPLLANCEHFATWAFYGVPESPQLKKCVVGAGVIGLAIWGLWGGTGRRNYLTQPLRDRRILRLRHLTSGGTTGGTSVIVTWKVLISRFGIGTIAYPRFSSTCPTTMIPRTTWRGNATWVRIQPMYLVI